MFDYKKYYKFSVDKYIVNMTELGKSKEIIEIGCESWANKIDGSMVEYFSERTGYCSGYLVHFDWCEEIDPYDM